MNGTISIRLAQRLLSISKEHDIQVDMTTMLALCEKADYDIRSCLATLYFLKSRRRPLRYSDVMNLNIGHKDNHKSLFQGTFWVVFCSFKYANSVCN
jgi:chromosome transmission fidelity protein 18